MTILDDEFDLDLRLSFGVADPAIRAGDGIPRIQNDDDTAAPQQTCPVDTCSLGCETQTCPSETCGCDTSETCDQRREDCGGGLTLGPYCQDASGGEDTCDACPAPVSDVCPDPS
jgi:hypothetical protein